MSLFAQLYLAGLATISLPILFHFLRRSPRTVLPYSSLMFLSPSLPRLTRRSRIDHWLLLLLRALALGLLALAFCRPYLRENSSLAWDAATGRQVAVLVDTSASMRRSGIWQQASQQLEQALEELRENDVVALYSFDRRLRVEVDFPEDPTQAALQPQAVRSAFAGLSPSWSAANLGAALTNVSTRLETADELEDEQRPLQIVLISDMASGSDLSALQGVSWPERVAVRVRAVASDEPNVGIELLERDSQDADPLANRFRVVNNSEGNAEVSLNWGHKGASGASDGSAGDSGDASPAITAPGKGSKVLRMKRPVGPAADSLDHVVLSGDAHDFDNVCYVVPPTKRAMKLLIWGDEQAENTDGVRFYWENALRTAQHQALAVVEHEATASPSVDELVRANLVLITTPLPPQNGRRLREAVESGARVLWVLQFEESELQQNLLNQLLPEGAQATIEQQDGKRADYALWTNVDFKHPFFSTLSGARYSDFTKVQFWRHRRLRWGAREQNGAEGAEGAEGAADKLPDPPASIRTLVQFDDGDIAVAHWPLGEGEVLLFTSGWQPEDSRLALSTKFVPLAASILDPGQVDQTSLQLVVDDTLTRDALVDPFAEQSLVVHKPNGDVVQWGASDSQFNGIDHPGIYRLSQTNRQPKQSTLRQGAEGADREQKDGGVGENLDAAAEDRGAGSESLLLAVNLAAAESRTVMLKEKELAANGVRLGESLALGVAERERQRKSMELEGRQKLWQWLVVGCLGVLILETLLAAYFARTSEAAAAEPETSPP